MRSVRHAAPFFAVAGLGALVLHQLVYALLTVAGGVRLTGEHGHLSAQWAVLTPIAVIGATVLVLRQIKNLGYLPDSAARLVSLSSLFFLTQEAIEALAAGGSPVVFLTSPAAVLGVFLSPLIGLGTLRILSETADILARFVPTPSMPLPSDRIDRRPAQANADTSITRRISPARGPPFLFA